MLHKNYTLMKHWLRLVIERVWNNKKVKGNPL